MTQLFDSQGIANILYNIYLWLKKCGFVCKFNCLKVNDSAKYRFSITIL